MIPDDEEHLVRKAQLEPQNQVHHENRAVHLVVAAGQLRMNRVAKEDECRIPTLQALHERVLTQDSEQVVHLGVEVADDDRRQPLRQLDHPAGVTLGVALTIRIITQQLIDPPYRGQRRVGSQLLHLPPIEIEHPLQGPAAPRDDAVGVLFALDQGQEAAELGNGVLEQQIVALVTDLEMAPEDLPGLAEHESMVGGTVVDVQLHARSHAQKVADPGEIAVGVHQDEVVGRAASRLRGADVRVKV